MGCACCKGKIPSYYEAKSGQSPGPDCNICDTTTLNQLRSDFANVKAVERICKGTIRIVNGVESDLYLQFVRSKSGGKHVCFAMAACGSEFVFDPGANKQFDFTLMINKGKAKAHVVRGGSYKVVAQGTALSVETLGLPDRIISEKLSNVRGLSVSMSASGWLVVYQLGAVECLQNHGIAKNPYVRVSGASGGALAVSMMMYGADPRAVMEVLIESANTVHSNPLQNLQLRRFVLESMRETIRDGSFHHPALKSRRVEIVVSASSSKMPGFFAKMLLTGSEKRCVEFQDSAQLAIALLASATIGISGLPFSMMDENGKEVVVADGGLKNFMPTIDEFSITVTPITLLSGDVRPTEFVPSAFGLFPPPVTMLRHLYELGYQDMEYWIENELDERLEALSAETAQDIQEDLPPVSFHCPNDGMLWYEDVLGKVPVGWIDMIRHSFHVDGRRGEATLREGELLLESLYQYKITETGETAARTMFKISSLFWVHLTRLDISWSREGEKPKLDSIRTQQLDKTFLLGTGFFGASKEAVLEQSQSGRIHLTWFREVVVDADSPEIFHVKAVPFVVSFRASSSEEAQAWCAAIQGAVASFAESMQISDHSDALSDGAATPRKIITI